jgi:hypothetical protein
MNNKLVGHKKRADLEPYVCKKMLINMESSNTLKEKLHCTTNLQFVILFNKFYPCV